ncbi:hypothetical protein KDA23_05660 [Candidatus Saccharibacteria bacterium]|nr:hypothetical protein [Candidatus Saccharibacteria bacterium]
MVFDLGLSLDGNSLQRLPPNATKEQQTAVINDILDRLNNLLKSQVFSDGTNKRMIIGYQKDGWGAGKDFGIKVSIEGVDVTEATDSQLLMKYDLQTFFYYDPDTGDCIGQVGLLPNGRNGEAWAKDGEDVNDAFGV